MKTIIIPTDFSAVAHNAMQYGLDLARANNASVLLFHAFQLPIGYGDVPVALVSIDELANSTEKKLQELRMEALQLSGGEIKIYSQAVLGSVVDELEKKCNKLSPFAVVMGTHGATGLQHILFGSTTLAVIRHLSWPVICVPPEKQFGNGIKKIGLACDFREVVETVPADFIKMIVKQFGAELHVLNVDHNEKRFRPETPEQSLFLDTMLQELKPQYHFIDHEDIEDGLNEFSGKNNIDLLITVPKKHKLLEGLFKPSSTKQLVTQSHIPVMCIHDTREEVHML